MKNSRSKFCKVLKIQDIVEIILTFVLAESNPLILQQEQVSPSRQWNWMGRAISGGAEQAKLCEVG